MKRPLRHLFSAILATIALLGLFTIYKVNGRITLEEHRPTGDYPTIEDTVRETWDKTKIYLIDDEK